LLKPRHCEFIHRNTVLCVYRRSSSVDYGPVRKLTPKRGSATLGKMLGEKPIPDRFLGSSSVSDNAFDSITRLMKISILIQENSEEIKVQMTSSPEFKKELYSVAQALEDVSRRFHEQSLHLAECIR
jgi:hypothetical protein